MIFELTLPYENQLGVPLVPTEFPESLNKGTLGPPMKGIDAKS
jgi:hypothetical protein